MAKVKGYNTKYLYFPNRMTQKLKNILEYPLTILEAPMGYGKTTAVREFLNETEARVLWLRVYDSSTVSFWNGFSKALGEPEQEAGRRLLQLGFPEDPVAMQDALDLIKEIRFSKKTVLVIDDYHLLVRHAVDKFVELLAVSGIPDLHIVLIARYTDMQNLEELSLKGYLYHIKKETFELQPKEIAAYYKACGISLSGRDAKFLYDATEGWISALYLLLLQYIADGNYMPSESIYKLIEKAVYVHLSDEIRELAVSMSIFDSFTEEQTNFIWGNKDGADFLAALVNSNSFVKYDSRLKSYHIHSIFMSFLRGELERREPDARQALWRKAAEWFLQTGEFAAARDHFYKCGDFDSIMIALERDNTNNFPLSNKELLKKYMKNSPSEVRARHPYALLIYAMHLFVHKDFETFHDACAEFSENLEKSQEMDPDLKNCLLGEYELMLSFAEFNDLKKMSARHQKAWKLLNRPTSIYNTGAIWTFGSPSILSLYYRESGRLAEHIRDIKEAMPYYGQLTNGHGSGAEYAMEAEAFFNMGDFENAEISIQKAILKAKTGQDENIILNAEYLQTLVAFMKGDLPKTADLIEKIHARTSTATGYYALRMIETCEYCIYSYLDQKDRIPQRLLQLDPAEVRLLFPAFAFFNIMYGRILLLNGEYLKMIGSEEYFHSIAAVFKTRWAMSILTSISRQQTRGYIGRRKR